VKLEEAIELLEREDRRFYPKRRLEAHLALKLGIEALKRLQKLRGYSMIQVDTRLPGETED